MEVIETIREQAQADAAMIGSTVAEQIDIFEKICGASEYAEFLRELHGIK